MGPRAVSTLGCGLLAAACGRVGFDDRAALGSGDAGGGALAIVAPPSMLPLTAVPLTATGGVIWTVQGGGAISAAGVLTAPAADADLLVTATSAAAPVQVASATIHVTHQVVTATIADTGSVTEPSGLGMQSHAVYDAGAWWLFYVSATAPGELRTRTSTDFATWSDGPAATLPAQHSADGRDLAVADRVLGGHHVVHVSVGGAAFARYHVRGVFAGGALTLGAPRLLNQGGVTAPDGPAVAILPSGTVMDSSGWDNTPQTPPLTPCGDGDVETFTSDTPDDGAASFDAVTFTRGVIWCVGNRVNARALVPDGDTLYELFEDGQVDPDPVNILMMIRQPSGAWLPVEQVYTVPPRVFATDISFSPNDWTVVALGRELHALRRTGTQAYEHRVLDLDAPTAWGDAPAPGPLATEAGQGIALAPYGSGLLALTIDGVGVIEYAFFDGAAWSPWHGLAMDAASRTSIAVAATGTSVHPGVFWSASGTLAGAALP